MELRLVSDPLLRSRMSPLLSLLAPSIPPLWRATAASPQMRLTMPEPPRYRSSGFHTTARQRAQSSSSAADLDFLQDEPRPKPQQPFRPSVAQKTRPNDVLKNQVDSLIDATFDMPNLAKKYPARNPIDSASEPSDLMIETAFQNSMRNRSVDKSHHQISNKMQFPSHDTAGDGKLSTYSGDMYRTLQTTQKNTARRAKRTVRSRPAVGRVIEVRPDRGVDVGRALRSLDIACAVNRVRADQAHQRFHERPGMKRKRLKRERWRKMFKESFKATVMRVREMRRKGW